MEFKDRKDVYIFMTIRTSMTKSTVKVQPTTTTKRPEKVPKTWNSGLHSQSPEQLGLFCMRIASLWHKSNVNEKSQNLRRSNNVDQALPLRRQIRGSFGGSVKQRMRSWYKRINWVSELRYLSNLEDLPVISCWIWSWSRSIINQMQWSLLT